MVDKLKVGGGRIDFPDLAVNPTANGVLQRNGINLVFHDGVRDSDFT